MGRKLCSKLRKVPLTATASHLLIEKLLKGNLTKTAIKKFFHISRYKLDKLIQELILLNSISTSRKSKLTKYRSLIQNWIEQGENIKSIQNHLKEFKINIHYTTIRRFVRNIESANDISSEMDLPGEVGYVSVLKIPQSNGYLFCFLLGYSYYSFFHFMKCRNLECFLQCHEECFRHLQGVPKKIHLCEASSIRLTAEEKLQYKRYLANFGSRFNGKIFSTSEKHLCSKYANRANKEILGTFFSDNIKMLMKSLKKKHIGSFNLCIHPVTQRPIYKEYEKNEKPKLLPFSRNMSITRLRIRRKVSARGRVCFNYSFYQLPKGYCGKTVTILIRPGQLIFIYSKKPIITLTLKDKNKSSANKKEENYNTSKYDYQCPKGKN